MKKLVVSIAGGSCSGKSTLVNHLKNHFPNSSVLSQDNYYKDLSHLPMEQRKQLNFDLPHLLDFELMTKHIDALLQGEEVSHFEYDFTKHQPSVQKLAIPSKPILFIEGLHVLGLSEIRSKTDVGIYIDVGQKTQMDRRMLRDQKDRGRSMASILKQMNEQVLPMHEKHVLPQKKYADLILQEQDDHIYESVKMIQKNLNIRS